MKNTETDHDGSSIVKQLMQPGNENILSLSLSPLESNFTLPALHSFASAVYQGSWIFIGGEIAGFHGTAGNPPPFMQTGVNDRIWVIDPGVGQTWSVPVPEAYRIALAVTNAQSCQLDESLYFCGGFTVSDANQPRLNATSKFFFRIDLANLVQYVQSGGTSPALETVFPIALEDNFVQVTGGEMMVVNNHFYLVGGQLFDGVYAAGSSGSYTNAVRSFDLQLQGSTWTLVNKNTCLDEINLHRRDFNLAPIFNSDGSADAVVLGGVFTPKDLSYNLPVFILGLKKGTVSIAPGSTQQQCNQYSSALVSMMVAPGLPMIYTLIGGLTYKTYSAATGGLVIGDHGIPMPFSNLVTFIITDGDDFLEYVQLPPEPLLPGYLGSNATFIPAPNLIADDYPGIVDLNKVIRSLSETIRIGYMFGGIRSNGPTSGTTPAGHICSYPNPDLYEVYLSLKVS